MNKKSNFKKEKALYMYGRHATMEAIQNRPTAIKKLFLSGEVIKDQNFMRFVIKHKIVHTKLKSEETKAKVGGDATHQGVIAEIQSSLLYTPFDEVIELAKKAENPCIVVLDELQDPHNVGAIIRSAAAFGALAVIIPEHNQAPVTGTVIKTSAGMVFRIPVVKVGNINHTLRVLKDELFTISGLVMNGNTRLKDMKFDTPTAYIVGNESEGIRQKTLELCDVTLSIPMDPRCESLNAATAASVVLYEYSRNILK